MERKTENTKKKKILLIIRISVLLLVIIASLWSWVPFTKRINLDLLETKNQNVRILLITDLHSCYYGKGEKNLIKRIDKENPDVILLGGDIFDDKLDDDNAKYLIEDMVTKYPCYYVTGNHEYWSERVDEMKKYMEDTGVTVLSGDCDTITINGVTMDICGVEDPTRLYRSQWLRQIESAHEETDDSHLKILLTHRPEEVEVYEKYDFDLILAGHAHAGQIRIPFINKGLYAPNQGFMAPYVNGAYELKNKSIMVVSRGLARESTPLPRFFNHPEIVVIDIN